MAIPKLNGILSTEESQNLCSGADAAEAAVLKTVSVRSASHLSETVEFLNGWSDLPVVKTDLDSIWHARRHKI